MTGVKRGFNQQISAFLVSVGAIIFVFGTLLVIVVQIFEFLSSGAWKWDTIGSYMLAANLNAEDFAEHLLIQKWPGVTEILLWLFFVCPAAALTVGTGLILALFGIACDQ